MIQTSVSYSNKELGVVYYSPDFPDMVVSDSLPVDPNLRLQQAEHRVDFAGALTETVWKKSFADAAIALKACRRDLARAGAAFRRARREVIESGKPLFFALWTALPLLVSMLLIEFLLSVGTIGPAFGFEPSSWEGIGVATLVLGVVGASHWPASDLLDRLKHFARRSAGWRRLVAVTLEVTIAAAILFANYKAVAALAPLRQQVALMLQKSAEATGLISPAASKGAPAGNSDSVDDKVLLECIYLLSVVVALDSILLATVVHDQMARIAARGSLRKSEKQRDAARNLFHDARKEYRHRRYVWRERSPRLESIKQAFLIRERCLLFPAPQPERDLPPRSWVNRMLTSASQLRRVS